MSRESDTLFAFLLGAVAGGAAALLLAPEKGERTRRRLRDAAQDLYVRGEEIATEALEEVEGRAQDAQDTAREGAERVAHKARHRVDAVRDAVDEARQTYQEELKRSRAEGV